MEFDDLIGEAFNSIDPQKIAVGNNHGWGGKGEGMGENVRADGKVPQVDVHGIEGVPNGFKDAVIGDVLLDDGLLAFVAEESFAGLDLSHALEGDAGLAGATAAAKKVNRVSWDYLVNQIRTFRVVHYDLTQ